MALRTLAIENNVSEGLQATDSIVVFRVSTSASATVTVQRSIDNQIFHAIPDLSFTIDGTDEIQLADCKRGQFLRVSADANLTEVKALH